MGNDKYSVNKLVCQLTQPFGAFFLKCHFKGEYIFNYYNKDVVDEKLLLKLLKQSVIISSLKQWILDVLCYVDEKSITDTVFAFCLQYPGKFRKTLLIQLAHMWLTESQLLTLNDRLQTPEAFCKLFILYVEREDISSEKLMAFLEKNDGFVHQIDCLNLLKWNNIDIPSEKQSVLQRLFN